TGWESLEPWLTRIEELEPQTIWAVAETVPPEWYGSDLTGMESLVEELVKRRGRVRELITGFRESSRAPFPNWGKTEKNAGTEQFAEQAWADDLKHGFVM
ncbi:MAG TPA: hypothetical protein VE178_07290, partial [Silvibacterium sp.]|nr:hypothetical protein [Silvibacterium sp.]